MIWPEKDRGCLLPRPYNLLQLISLYEKGVLASGSVEPVAQIIFDLFEQVEINQVQSNRLH